MTVKVSVIIASYRPGDAVLRVIDSLDAQTLAQDEFEVIFVDDGSPDDTVERLRGFAATRPNIKVDRIKNSGWPSRPRNVGIEQARGEYVMFMDHDDSLYPDGLRRAYEYAVQNDADILSPKESKTNDVWWGTSSLTGGNLPNALDELGVARLLPMVPHKLYRRRLLMDHQIRFPEGSRVLWEDWFINLDAFTHAKVVSVLADTPVYLWHASDANSSHTFHPSRVDFWDRLEDLMAYVARALGSPADSEARDLLLSHHVRTRVIDRCVRLAQTQGPSLLGVKRMALRRSQQLLARFVSDDVYALLPKKHQGQLFLIHGGDLDLMTSFHRADLAIQASTTALDPHWEDGRLVYDTVSRWEPRSIGVPAFERRGGRVVRSVGTEIARMLPPELLDHTDDAEELVVELAARSRAECVTWMLPLELDEARFETGSNGYLTLVRHGRGEVDLGRAAFGNPLDDTVWDIRTRTEWLGMERKGPIRYGGPPLPVLLRGRGGVAYRNASEGLSLDLDGRLRSLTIDARPAGGAGAIDAFAVDLTNVSVFGRSELDAGDVRVVPEPPSSNDVSGSDHEAGEPLPLRARVVADAGVARLEGGADLGPGDYVLYAYRQDKLHKTSLRLTVDGTRQATFHEVSTDQVSPNQPA